MAFYHLNVLFNCADLSTPKLIFLSAPTYESTSRVQEMSGFLSSPCHDVMWCGQEPLGGIVAYGHDVCVCVCVCVCVTADVCIQILAANS